MATFKAQVEGITQLTVGTTPTEDELSQFLVDGTKEVTNRIITIRPDELSKFTTSIHDAADNGITATGRILSVVREHDSESILRNCTLVAPGDRYAASDSTSLKYRSAYNPGFYELAGKIHTIPASAGGNNDAIVTQVYYAVNQGHSSSSIDSFPDEYEYLVVLYASLRTIHAHMSALPVASVTDFSLAAVVPDSIPDPIIGSSGIAPVTKADISGNQPQYNAGAVIGFAASAHFADLAAKTITDLSVISVPPDVPSSAIAAFSGIAAFTGAPSTVTTFSGAPTYTAPVVGGATEELTTTISTGTSGTDVSDWFKVAGDYIQTEEDSELATSQMDKIAAYVNTYTAQVASNLNDFNELNTAYQADIQKKIKEFDVALAVFQADVNKKTKEADLDAQEKLQQVQQDLAKYSAELTDYQQAVNKEVQEWQANTNKDIQIWQNQQGQIIAQHQAKMADALNLFNKENSIYQANIQAELAKFQADVADAQKEGDLTLQAAIQDYTLTLQKYQSDVQTYAAEVNAEVQEYQSYLAGKTKQYEWCVDQYNRLKGEYDTAFIALRPPQQEEARGGRNRRARA